MSVFISEDPVYARIDIQQLKKIMKEVFGAILAVDMEVVGGQDINALQDGLDYLVDCMMELLSAVIRKIGRKPPDVNYHEIDTKRKHCLIITCLWIVLEFNYGYDLVDFKHELLTLALQVADPIAGDTCSYQDVFKMQRSILKIVDYSICVNAIRKNADSKYDHEHEASKWKHCSCKK